MAAFTEHQPEVVIHMAAQSTVRYYYSYPVDTYAVNLMGTVHLLEAVGGSFGSLVGLCQTPTNAIKTRIQFWAIARTRPWAASNP